MAVVKARRVAGESTSEAAWSQWELLRVAPEITASDLVPAGARAVVIAPHPDDEILMAGGLLQQLRLLGRDCRVIAVTDGEGSHPGSALWPVERLRRERPVESQRALGWLVEGGVDTVRLHLPDAGLADHADILRARLDECIAPGDVVITTWAFDGHPDHDACGAQAAATVAAVGARLIEAPVWTWHWSVPGDARVPWHRARRLPLGADQVARKQAAAGAFASQLEPDPTTGRDAVLPASALARLARTDEVFFT